MKRTPKILKKLKDVRGESLSEILIALLVSSLAIVLLAGMINASSTMISNSREKVADYVSADRSVVEQNGSSETGTVSIKEGSETITLTDGAGSITVVYYSNSENESVKSYRVAS
ncbi:MAG: hypothetical protein IJV00_07230 [Clostridia bacterium]|nr:hypothetical protein [Clostridia bacterium]